jgi:hypothetical protein
LPLNNIKEPHGSIFRAFTSNTNMKTLFRIIGALYFGALLCLLSGCRFQPLTPKPGREYVEPSLFIGQIASADRIVVANRLAGQPGAPKFTSFSLTITGNKKDRIITSISSLRARAIGWGPAAWADTSDEWQLQFYRGSALLGTADFSSDLVFCEGFAYQAPWVLRRLHHRVTKESGEHD